MDIILSHIKIYGMKKIEYLNIYMYITSNYIHLYQTHIYMKGKKSVV